MLRFKIFALLFFIAVILAACGTRKHAVNPSTTKAAKVANAMAALKSKPLYRFINDWTGVRYLLGSMDKKGIDCSGFAYLLQKDIYGQILPRVAKDQANAITNKDINDLKEGDLLFFSFNGKAIDHVGVFLNTNFFVHASTTRGVIVDDLTLPVYKKALVKGGSLKK